MKASTLNLYSQNSLALAVNVVLLKLWYYF